jgi:hypothetical protein
MFEQILKRGSRKKLCDIHVCTAANVSHSFLGGGGGGTMLECSDRHRDEIFRTLPFTAHNPQC